MKQNVKASSSYLSVVEKQLQEDEQIMSLDPLRADEILTCKLPAMNMGKDVRALAENCYNLLPYPVKLQAFDYHEAVAAMRDLGFFLGSMKRHGVEPVEAVPELDYVLDVLGNKTGLPPRDTLLHYTSWNPDGIRRRTYTGTHDENHLVHSVKIAMLPLLEAIFDLDEAYSIPFNDLSFATQCERVSKNFDGMVKGVVHSRKNVSTEFFANELRFYFDPIKLHGKVFLGPGAVEMPLFVYDHILWSCRSEDMIYNQFKETYLPYILPYVQDIYDLYKFKPSLLDKACTFLNEATKKEATVLQSVKGLQKLCTQLKSFRMPHKKLAEEAYSYGKQEHRKQGSGGYSTDILSHIITHNLQFIQSFEEAVKRYEALG